MGPKLTAIEEKLGINKHLCSYRESHLSALTALSPLFDWGKEVCSRSSEHTLPELLFSWTIRITRLVLFILSLLHCCCFGDSCCQSYNFLFSFSVSRRFIMFCRTSLQLFSTFLSQCCTAALHRAVFLIMDKLYLVAGQKHIPCKKHWFYIS